MSPGDAIGYLASALVLLAFSARSIAALRMAAVASNLAFIAYGLAVHLPPVLALHAVLLPLNLWRLCELRGGWAAAMAARHSVQYNAAMDARRAELLQRMPVFGALDERALHFLVECAHQRDVPAGDWFFREGDQARAMFVLERGRAIVTRQWQGREVELNRFGPGDCFGEMALMDLHPRSAGVRALEDCTAIEFGPEEMMQLHDADLEQFALLQMNLGRELSRRLRATDELLFRAAMGELLPAPPPLR